MDYTEDELNMVLNGGLKCRYNPSWHGNGSIPFFYHIRMEDSNGKVVQS